MNILELALTLELDLERYYKEQAELNKGNGLNSVFSMLARDEGNHADILKMNSEKIDYELKDNDTLVETRKIFEKINDFKSDIKDVPSQFDSYRMALDKEKQSMDAYEKLLAEAKDEKVKTMFRYLIKQEKEHYEILDELVELLNRPDDWVEAAEFGLRKEY